MAEANLSGDSREQTGTLKELQCVTGRADEIRYPIILLAAANIILSITACLGNTLILVAFSKESSLHPPSKLLYRCLATTDLCAGLISQPSAVMYWLSLLHEDWSLCLFAELTNFVASYTLTSVSLLTLTAISVDRLLALLLGLRYRQVVTLRRTYLLLIIFWMVSIPVATSVFFNPRIAFQYSYIGIPLCLLTATLSYTKIFHRLHRNKNQVQVLQQPNQPAPQNMLRYKKAVHSALWLQLVLVGCYLPYGIVRAVLRGNRLSPSEFLVYECVETLIYLNSSLNPFLYCWKISEVRQAVKQTMRQTLSYP